MKHTLKWWLFSVLLVCAKNTLADSEIQKILQVNNSQVICTGAINERLWICYGEKYQGIIDHKSSYDNYPFTAFLFSDEGLDAQIKIPSIDINDQKQETNLLYDYCTINFDALSLRHYISHQMMLGLCPFKAFKIMNVLQQFEGHFNVFKERLLSCFIRQKLVWVNGVIYSDFIPDLSRDRGCQIESFGQEDFSDEQKQAYQSLINSQGVSISLERAQTLFIELSQHPDIPFAYTSDGCYARAHFIADILAKRGYKTGKI